MKKRILIFAFFFVSSMLNLHAQLQKDYVSQFGISIEKKFSRSLSFTFFNQEAFNQNSTELAYSYADVGLQLRLNRNFYVAANYRFGKFRRVENFYENRQMIYADLGFSKTKNKFTLGIRTRLQNTYYGEMFEQNYHDSYLYSRNRISLRYKINYYWSPYISFDWFYPLNVPARDRVDQYRETAGFYYTINDRIKIEIYYQLQQLVARKHKKDNYVTTLNLYYRF